MGFFDLNIPYLESSPSDNNHKTTRLKTVIKAMELGYSGIAYNRMFKGVMSDHDRCSISLLSLSSLLKIAPSLSSSVNFHRDLLGIPRATPFRQYTRLTVCADTVTQCQVLNNGNPVLKSYDLVAVRPLNQSAFDYACEKAEVDIISIDFAEKVPFRLRLPMVKAAIERGVYFEINYTGLILDVQLRRQLISNAKLLVDWTREKNLILSSGAPSVNELRGPYDVANLSSLLGISTERAKAAVSKNCRTLISNALRKKQYHKETIRVEAISSGEQFDSRGAWSGDWLKWDPISSGEGDLQLDEMAKSFTASSKVSKTVKAINFASIVDSMPSHGFQVKDVIFGTPALSQSQDSGKNILTATEAIDVPVVATNGVSEQPSRLDLLPETDKAPSKQQPSGCENTPKLRSDFSDYLPINEDIGTHTTISEEESKNPNVSDELFAATETERCDQHSQNCVSSCVVDVVLSKEIVKCQASTQDIELDAVCNADAGSEGAIPSNAFDFPACQNEEFEFRSPKSFNANVGAQNVRVGETTMEIDSKDPENVTSNEQLMDCVDDEVVFDQSPFQESYNEMKVVDDSSISNHETLDNVTLEEQRDKEQLREPGDDRFIAAQIPTLDSCNEITIKDDCAVADHEATMEKQMHGEQFREPGDGVDADQISCLDSYDETGINNDDSVANHEAADDVTMEEQMNGEADSEINCPILVECTSGKIRSKPKMLGRPLLFPLKRLLNPIPFKKKASRFMQKTKKM